MPTKAASHIENCLKLCLMCFNKSTQSKPGSRARRVTQTMVPQVRKHYMSDFDLDSPLYPIGLCSGHRKLLGQVDDPNDPKTSADLPELYDFSQLTIPTRTRSALTAGKYPCELCELSGRGTSVSSFWKSCPASRASFCSIHKEK